MPVTRISKAPKSDQATRRISMPKSSKPRKLTLVHELNVERPSTSYIPKDGRPPKNSRNSNPQPERLKRQPTKVPADIVKVGRQVTCPDLYNSSESTKLPRNHSDLKARKDMNLTLTKKMSIDGQPNDSVIAKLFSKDLLLSPEADGKVSADLFTGNLPQRRLVLSGRINELPSLKSKIVRIFLSSTFSDMELERNVLMKRVYPELKDYCREIHGLDFQVVDMRWGVTDQATDDHKTTRLCMKEIENCQRLSVGPNFVAFLGQRYGYRPLPTHIIAEDFEELHGAQSCTPSDGAFLKDWYKRDDNALPPIYDLQPISSILVHFNQKNKPDLRREAQRSWWTISEKLQEIIRKAAKSLVDTGEYSQERLHQYNMSVTEMEIRKGILEERGDVDAHCLAYIRNIKNIDVTNDTNKAKCFIDINQDSQVDDDAQTLLADFRDQQLPSKLHLDNIRLFDVEWVEPSGLNNEDHAEYLEYFATNFQESVIHLVDKAVSNNQSLADDLAYEETLQHLHACKDLATHFQGRKDIIDSIEEYIKSEDQTPYVIFGLSGSGKTSIMAKSYSQVVDWMPLESSPVTLLRFLGTSPDSSTIIPLLKSLCHQISANYEEVTSKATKLPEDISPLIKTFKRKLTLVTAEKPLVIFLDSLDQLSPADGAYQLVWLPIKLPAHVKIVLSTAILEDSSILENLRKILRSERSFLHVVQLGQELGVVILETWLHNHNRTVTQDQWTVIKPFLAKCNLPLYIKLIFDEIVEWKSYGMMSSKDLCKTVHDSILTLFSGIEKIHGRVLTTHALMYLTASKSGLSESELEDILSLDEEVLTDVYQYHLPPVRRIPPLLWTRIRSEMPNYVTEREADGANVIDWYHRQFRETAMLKYFKNMHSLHDTHSRIADYFLGVWGDKPKPFEYSEAQRLRFHLKDTTAESDRLVPAQPNYYEDESGMILHYNLRKMNELPYHLVRSERFEDLYREVLFNFKWLYDKLAGMPFSSIIADFEDALSYREDREVKLIVDALRLSSFYLQNYPRMLGGQLLARLLPHYEKMPKICRLLRQCDDEVGMSVNALLPAYHSQHTPGGPLQFSLEGHPRAVFGMVFSYEGNLVVTVSNILLVWDITTGEIVKTVRPTTTVMMKSVSLSRNDNMAVCITRGNKLVMISLRSERCKIIDDPIDEAGIICCIAVAENYVLVVSRTDIYKFDFNANRLGKYGFSQQDRFHVSIILTTAEERHLVVRTDIRDGGGAESDEETNEESKLSNAKGIYELEGKMALELHTENGEIIDSFAFDGPMTFNRELTRIYVCQNTELEQPPQIEVEAPQDTAWRFKPATVSSYEKTDTGWTHLEDIGTTHETVFYVSVSWNENLIVTTHVYGHRLWNRKLKKMFDLRLSLNLRNIPNRKRMGKLVTFTNDGKYVVTAVREKIHVWCSETGVLKKNLDAHVKRITEIVAVPGGNKVISSSLDTTIKVWNFDNVLEKMFPLDRVEKKIETLSVAAEAPVAITTTRSDVNVWNLETGRLERNLVAGSHTSLVTKAIITNDGKTVITGEAGFIHMWNVASGEIIKSDRQVAVQKFIMIEKETRFITLSRQSANVGLVVCRHIPTMRQSYSFEFNVKRLKDIVLTFDGLHVIVPAITEDGKNILKKYHARTGTHLMDMPLEYDNYKEFTHIAILPHDINLIAIVDPDKSVIYDIKNQKYVRAIKEWNGICTRDGEFGLLAPLTGGLHLISLEKGKTSSRKRLLPRINEGLISSTKAFFIHHDNYVVYYHGGQHLVKVIRLCDGFVIGEHHIRGEGARLFESNADGLVLVVALAAGSVLALVLADPLDPTSKVRLANLPSRHPSMLRASGLAESDTQMPSTSEEAKNNGVKLNFRTIVKLTMATAKAKKSIRSRACVIS